MNKVHIKVSGKALCGTRRRTQKLRFVDGSQVFKAVAEDERCKNCERSITR